MGWWKNEKQTGLRVLRCSYCEAEVQGYGYDRLCDGCTDDALFTALNDLSDWIVRSFHPRDFWAPRRFFLTPVVSRNQHPSVERAEPYDGCTFQRGV